MAVRQQRGEKCAYFRSTWGHKWGNKSASWGHIFQPPFFRAFLALLFLRPEHRSKRRQKTKTRMDACDSCIRNAITRMDACDSRA